MILVKDGRPCDEWVLYSTFDSLLNASLTRGFLEAEGIPCLLENEYTATTGYAPAAPLRLLVPASLLVRARELCEPAENTGNDSGGAGRDRTGE
ncbi:MAG: DUF2007 domain-containing protein [Acidobacteria bacterium]|nr:DUF2007 domain-containing protein [Acidobacteriota bacterium]